MHHSDQPDPNINERIRKLVGPGEDLKQKEDLKKAMEALTEKLGLGATGQFPEGKLAPGDEGEIKIAVGTQDGKVIINFGKPVVWIGFSPTQARELAESIRQQSYKA